MPSDPVSIAAVSDNISPNKLSVTITSNCLGQRHSCIAPASAYICESSTSEYSAWCILSTVSRHRTPDSITFAFSIEQTLLPRLLANSKADLATRSISLSVYRCVLIPTRSFPSVIIPLGSPKYIPEVSSLTIIMSKPETTSVFKEEKSAKASKHCAGRRFE